MRAKPSAAARPRSRAAGGNEGTPPRAEREPEGGAPTGGKGRRAVSLRRSPLARRIVAYNLAALALLVAGVLHLDPFRDGLAAQREQALASEARLVAAAVEARLGASAADPDDLARALRALALPEGTEAAILDPARPDAAWREAAPGSAGDRLRAEAPVRVGGQPVAVLVLSRADDVGADLARAERGAVLRLFALVIAVSVALGLVLASTIAGPLADLAQAAEAGHGGATGKVRIPDLSARRDEIGRLSAALRGLVAALVERVDAEERFAADVAHEIKNPLASLGSAVGALRRARPDQRARLLDVIEHDLRRLDRLVSDISNISRLDSELVRETEAPFDLSRLLSGLAEHLGHGARDRGVAVEAHLPPQPLTVPGLEARLAQVFVNLIDNAVSFCEPGGTVRLRARRQGGRVVVSVEDTGPGIPEAALERVFERFYSERPEGQFGNNSGLGLAISKQIVEAHGGMIWAENILPEPAAPGAAPGLPRGARLVVSLPA